MSLLTRPAAAGPAPAGPGRPLSRGVWVAVGVLAVAILGSIFIGSNLVSPAALFDPGSFEHTVLMARLPRTAVALAVGAALALAGASMQGLTRNPLADPGLLGLSAGASFGVVVALSWVGVTAMSTHLWFAFAGSAVAAVVVHGVAAFGGGATPAKLVLAGSAVSAGLLSWTNAILLMDHQTLDVFRRWMVGNVAGRDWDLLLTAAPFLLAGTVLALAGARVLDTLALGDDLAKGLGRRTALDRLVVGVAVVLLAGSATALAGPIAFVGLVVPHAVRALVGSSYARVLPLSIVGGAALVTIADTVGRVILPPTEVQVGIMTAVVGVPVFVWFLRRGRMAGL